MFTTKNCCFDDSVSVTNVKRLQAVCERGRRLVERKLATEFLSRRGKHREDFSRATFVSWLMFYYSHDLSLWAQTVATTLRLIDYCYRLFQTDRRF